MYSTACSDRVLYGILRALLYAYSKTPLAASSGTFARSIGSKVLVPYCIARSDPVKDNAEGE